VTVILMIRGEGIASEGIGIVQDSKWKQHLRGKCFRPTSLACNYEKPHTCCDVTHVSSYTEPGEQGANSAQR
jgi:hypothetical protein